MNNLLHFAAENLLNSLPLGVALTALAWVANRLLQRSGAVFRFSVWLAAMFGIVLIPLVLALRGQGAIASTPQSTGALILPDSAAGWLLLAWVLGASLGLAQIAYGLLRLRRIRRACTQVPLNQLDPVLRATLEEVQVVRRVSLCVSSSVRVPAALGYFRPAVVFPAWVLADLKPLEIKGILLHELAHLRRYDDWTNLLQKLVRALFFFHPAVWFIDSRLTLEREMACDDVVLSTDFSPRTYAEALLELAEKSFLQRGVLLAQAAVGQVQQLRSRLAEILSWNKSQKARDRSPISRVVILSFFSLVLVYGLAHPPSLVKFSVQPSIQAGATSAESNKLQESSWGSDGGDNPRPSPYRVRFSEATASRRRSGRNLQPAVVFASANPVLPRLPFVVAVYSREISADGSVAWKVAVFEFTPHVRPTPNGEPPRKI